MRLFAVLLVLCGCQSTAGMFRGPDTFGVTQNPTALAAGNFDEDGLADLAVISANDAEGIAQLDVLRGNGHGGFSRVASEQLVEAPAGVLAADIDHDSHADVVVSSFDDEGALPLTVLYGRGDGTFDPPEMVLDGYPVGIMTAGDLDEDGATDLIVANQNQLGTPDGFEIYFGPDLARRVSVDGTTLQLAVGDVNEDGHLDIVSADGVHLGAGNGTFASSLALDESVAPADRTALELADLDRDGHLDLAYAVSGVRQIAVLWGDGAGHLGQGATFAVTNSLPRPIVSGDFDQDGEVDLAVGGWDRNGLVRENVVSVLPGRGNRFFDAPMAGVHVDAGTANALLAIDLDGDGAPDLVGTDQSADTISVLMAP
jgi:hypothetical protein